MACSLNRTPINLCIHYNIIEITNLPVFTDTEYVSSTFANKFTQYDTIFGIVNACYKVLVLVRSF